MSHFEHILTNHYKADLVAWMHDHPEAFDEAIALACSDRQPYAWRASWLLWSCMENNDARITSSVKEIMGRLADTGENHQRELIKILYNIEIPEHYEGCLFDICAGLWTQPGKQPSIRYNAFKLIFKIARHHPSLVGEVKLLVDEQYLETVSPLVKKGVLEMVGILDKTNQM